MSRPRFLADHDLHDAIVSGTLRREPAVEFSRLIELDLHRVPDSDVLEYAAREKFIVVSHDVNTLCQHAYARVDHGQPMPGVFITQQGGPIGAVIEDLLLIWAATEAEDWESRVTFLPLAK